MPTHRIHLLALFVTVLCSVTHAAQPSTVRSVIDSSHRTGSSAPLAIKVMIITFFAREAEPWLNRMPFTEHIPVKGLSASFPDVHCTASNVCLMTTGMGHTNAAASTIALILSDQFDLSHTYFITAGIAGINPEKGTIGAATWARFAVDFGLAHEIDAREMPPDWSTGYFGIRTSDPTKKPNAIFHSEVFQLDEAFLQRALSLSRQATLIDSASVQSYRSQYSHAAARGSPSVLQCDTSSSDTYWHGEHLGLRAAQWTHLLTDGRGTYCTTQQEDNATLESLNRGAAAGLLDLRRIAILRVAKNFDRPYAGQSAYESLKNKSLGNDVAIGNLFLAAWPVVDDIVSRWPLWHASVPTD